MRVSISSICIILIVFPANIFAEIFRCDMGGVFDDKTACNSFCDGLPCNDLSQRPSSNLSPCDNSKYHNFVYINGKTYALTKRDVSWDSENTAVIRNASDNAAIVALLKATGVSEAWIGVYDSFQMSTAYNVVEVKRFSTRYGTPLEFSNWAMGEPNNNLNLNAVGNASLYGEYWAVIDQNGKWRDVGLNNDGSEKLLPAVVEWSGELSCVSGIEKESDRFELKGMVCGNEDINLGVNFQTCSEGDVFQGDKGYLCPLQKTSCIEGEENQSVIVEKEVKGMFPAAYIEGRPVGSINDMFGDGEPMITTTFPVTYGPPTVRNTGNGIINYEVAGVQTTETYVYGRYDYSTATLPSFRQTIQAVTGNILSQTIFLDKVQPASCDFDYKYAIAIDRRTGQQVSANRDICNNNIYLFGKKYDFYLINYPIQQGNSFSNFIYEGNISYTLKYQVEEQLSYPTWTCPETGRPCINSGEGYFCSPYDCGEGSDRGNFQKSPEETEEGSNDADNNGAVDNDGNCLGQLVIFPGRDSRCRLEGTQSKFAQCCKVVAMDKANKPDFRVSKLAASAALLATGLGSLSTLWSIFGGTADFKICNGSERQLWVNRGQDLCYEVGNYCAEKWLGICVQKKRTFCCFDSEFSRAFNEAGMDMLQRGWGTPQSPRCGGFSPEELQKLSAMGISEHPKLRNFADKLGKEYGNKLLNEFEKNFNSKSLEGKFQEEIQGIK